MRTPPAGAITRFAPSPTGRLHLGHAHAALFAWRLANRTGGRFLLRLEDIDRTRCRPEYAVAALHDLRWLGLDWDGPVRVQSAHLAEYRAALDRLRTRDLLYPCFCTRADILAEAAASAAAPHGPDGIRYPGTCRALDPPERARRVAAGAPHALRLDLARAMAAVPALTIETLEAGRIAADPAPFGDPRPRPCAGRASAPAAAGAARLAGADLRAPRAAHRRRRPAAG